jgi:two-component system invasion response regulator UvrY
MNKISIMIVDDHRLIRETWSYLLNQDEEFEVIAETGDGDSCIEIARVRKPDVVLLDINMQPVNGFETLKMIRILSPATKIIALSMHAEIAYVKKMLRLGAAGYVTKNSPKYELADAIREVSKGNSYICDEIKNSLSDKVFEEGPVEPDIKKLSQREVEIVKFVKKGYSSKDIGGILGIHFKTVEVHRHNILKKLKQKNSLSLIHYLTSLAVEF